MHSVPIAIIFRPFFAMLPQPFSHGCPGGAGSASLPSVCLPWPGSLKKPALGHNRDLFLILTFSLLVYVTVQAALLGRAAASVQIDALNSRLLAPLYVPLLLIFAAAIGRFIAFASQAPELSSLRRRIILSLALLLVAAHATPTAGLVIEALRSGAGGYRSRHWVESPTAEHLRQINASGRRVYTNEYMLAYLNGIETGSEGMVPLGNREALARWRNSLPEGANAFFVWVPWTGWGPQPEEYLANAKTVLGLREVITLPDGTQIFRFQS